MLHLCECETLIESAGFIYYITNLSELRSFKAAVPTQLLYLKSPKFLSLLIRQALKTAFSLANFEKGYCLLSSIAASNFLLSHALMLLDGQILVILKYPLTVLKPMVDIQYL